MKKGQFEGKNILITGITGFVGSHLAKRLQSLNANVYGISRTVSGKRILNTDITDFVKINAFFKKNKIHICFHLAGEALVETGQKDPYETYKTNTQGTLNILESSRRNQIDRIIIASTSHVYGNNKLPHFENYVPRPTRPYETSKACTDLIAQSYVTAYNLPVLIPRFVNIYGPGDRNHLRLIPKTILSVLKNDSPRMWGGSVKRDYLYIDDAIEAYLSLASVEIEKVGPNRVFNFGADEIISVKDLMRKIIRISKKELRIIKVKEKRDMEIRNQYVSWKKAKKILGWMPRVNLDTGLKKTMDWYSDYFSKQKNIDL